MTLEKVGLMDEYCIMMCGKERLGVFRAASLRDLTRTFLSDEETDTKVGCCSKIYKIFEQPL